MIPRPVCSQVWKKPLDRKRRRKKRKRTQRPKRFKEALQRHLRQQEMRRSVSSKMMMRPL